METAKVYKSAIDKRLVAFIAIVYSAVIVASGSKGYWTVIVILLPTAVLIINLFLSTYYTISGTVLTVKSGFFVNLKIEIATIRKIQETNTLLSAPAASLDRLEITYNKYDSVVISPKNKHAFINDILAVNGEIAVLYK